LLISGYHIANPATCLQQTSKKIAGRYGTNSNETGFMLEPKPAYAWSNVFFNIQSLPLEYVMAACAENNKELLILDRPNPNAYVVDGPVMTDDKFKSGIGIHYTPMTHGMTIGEFAQYLNGEGYLEKQCKIKIIKVANYGHDMPYVLPIHPSPNLNTQQAVMLFPSLCMFEGTAINEGRGTYMPFTILGAPALKGKYSFSYKPVSIPGMSESPRHKDAVMALTFAIMILTSSGKAAKLIYCG
jgi:Protein of unknown function (DUF1343)